MSKMKTYAQVGIKVINAMEWIESLLLLPFKEKQHRGVKHPALIKRGIAFSIDIIVVFALMAAALFIGEKLNIHPFLIVSLTVCVGMPLYFIITTATMSRTVGKVACDIRVNIRGKKNKWLTITLRELLRGVSALILPVTVLVALASKTNNTLHDSFAGTYLTVDEDKEQ